MNRSVLSVGLILAWLVTPESLVFVTRGSGIGGLLFAAALICGGLLALANTMVIHNSRLLSAGYDKDLQVLTTTFGKVMALVILFSGRIPLILLLSTGMLVSGGFVFNEIFVYWFPNFLFAVLLLILLVFIQLFTGKKVLIIQNGLVVAAVSGLLFLGGLGVFAEPGTSQSYSGIKSGFSMTLMAMGCIPFLGFDFPRSPERRLVLLSITGGLLLLLIWALLAMKLKDPSYLAESAVAYRSMARAVAGDPGGYIVGTVVICGVLAGCNALMHIHRRIFSDLVEANYLPSTFSSFGWLVCIVLAAVIAGMMFSGLAGDKILETQILAALVLWFFYVGLRSMAAAYLSGFPHPFTRMIAFLPGLFTLFMGAILVAGNSHVKYMIIFILGVVAGALLLALIIFVVIGRHLPHNPLPRRKKT